MQLSLSTYFQVGFAIGTNDKVFEKGLKSLNCYKGAVIVPRHNKSLKNLLGDGLTFDITNTDIFADWKTGAFKLLDNEKFHKEFEINDELLHDIHEISSKKFRLKCTIGIYSCGMGTVEVSIAGLDDDVNPEALFRFGQMFEFASYSDYDCGTDFQHGLLNESRRVMNHFVKDDSEEVTLKNIMTLPEDKDSDEDFNYNFFRSFTLIFRSNSKKTVFAMKDFRDAHDDGYVLSSYNGAAVYSSWYTVIVADENEDTTIVDLVRIYTLFYGASEMMNEVMNNVIYDILSMSADNDKLDLLIKLQLTGNLIINNTSMNCLTQNEELMAVFRKLNRNGNIEGFHGSIERSLDVCADIKSQFAHEREKIEDEEEKERDDRINFFVILFTSLTFVSVATDFLSLNEFAEKHITNGLTRGLVYFGVMAVFILIIIWLFYRKRISRYIRKHIRPKSR